MEQVVFTVILVDSRSAGYTGGTLPTPRPLLSNLSQFESLNAPSGKIIAHLEARLSAS
jgi:hypothetical protein